ncbi:dual specificity phosphatase 19 [Marasmius crinis-equi]|uniref:protein-tyrosine-phosphatase n=1 Tax=Marasmius crinis-equi TaxID=585013 RepID=A0ABR3F6U5_9AGAR
MRIRTLNEALGTMEYESVRHFANSCVSIDLEDDWNLTRALPQLVINYSYRFTTLTGSFQHSSRVEKVMRPIVKEHEYGIDNNRLLIYCSSGISLAPAMLTAFLMVYHRCTFDKAFGLVSSRRRCVDIPFSFENRLRDFEIQLFSDKYSPPDLSQYIGLGKRPRNDDN